MRQSIRQHLRGKTVLLTGGTGFLGKVIVERLLSAAPEIERIYLLIRTACEPASARFENEVVSSSAFDALARMHGDGWPALVRGKVSPVAGDVSQPRIGLADDVHAALASRIDIVINAAASVVFDAPIDEALRHNTCSVQYVAEFARTCRSAVLVHVSTAFVTGQRTGRIAEGPLAPDVSSREIDAIEEVVATVREEAAAGQWSVRATRGRLAEEGMTRARRLGWHDTYTYTKALGEMVLERDRGDVPTAIMRPAIIESGLGAPEPGWIQNLNVLDPMIAEYGRGRLPDFPLGRDTVLDVVPVDLVANAVVAVLPRVPDMRRAIGYYTVGSGALNPLTGGRLYELGREYFLQQPMYDKAGRAIVPPQWTLPSPERFREMFAAQAERSLTMKRLMYLANLYTGYANIECVFDTTNAQHLLDELDDADRAQLDFDVRRIDWRTYIQDVHIPGLRRHVLRDGTGATEVAGA
jgi:fatty acyl-CoA reductase